MSLSNLNDYVGAIAGRLGDAFGQVAPGVMGGGADEYLTTLQQQRAAQDAAFSDYAYQRMAQQPSAAPPGVPGAFQGGPLPGADSFGAWMTGQNTLQASADAQTFSRLGQHPSNPFAATPATAAASGTPASGTAKATTVATEPPGSGMEPNVARYWPLIQRAAAQYGEDPTLLAAIVTEESHGDPTAVSSAGAEGLGQVMPGEFQAGEDWRDPATNITAAARVLAQKYQANQQDWDLAVRGYHGFGTDGNTTDQEYLTAVKGYQQAIQRGLTGGGQAAGARAAAGTGKGFMAVTGGAGDVMQGFGDTDYSNAHPETYAFGAQYGLDGHAHTGIDIAVPRGTQLYSPASGVVTYAGGTGYYKDDPSGDAPGTGELMLTLDDGTQVILGHTSRIAVRVGQRVTAGEAVALSGGSDGDHVHLEVRVVDRSTPGGYRIVDPSVYFGG